MAKSEDFRAGSTVASEEPPTVGARSANRAAPTRIDRAVPEYVVPAHAEERERVGGPDIRSEEEDAIYPGATEEPEPTPPRAPKPTGSLVGRDLAALLLRLALGAFLVVRGAQELFGWFGGSGGLSLASQLEKLGYHSFSSAATAVSIAELVIGVLLVLGLFTEWACGALLTLSIVAVLGQHRLGSGLLARPGTGLGAELPGLEVVGGLGVLAVVLALLGAGRLALDSGRFWSRAPLLTALVALALGAALGILLIQPQLA